MSLQLADVLQEAREDLQQAHEDRVEMLRLAHVREVDNIRQKYREEVWPLALKHNPCQGFEGLDQQVRAPNLPHLSP